ncbi:MAG TPA: hypothetical protein VIL55_04235 [Naasia sp.]|jgi:ABC-type transport system involved in multi-copper enzyme maturation permease subunit
MTTLIRSEFLQLRTLRSSYATAVTLVVLTVGLAWGDVADSQITDPAEHFASAVLVGAGFVTALVGALFAAARVAGDYRYATIVNRVLATPGRTKLLMGRLVSFSILGILSGLVATALAVVTAAAVLDAEGTAVVVSAGDAAGYVARIVAAAVLFTSLGALLGFLLRSQQAAMVAIFGTFLAEKALASALGDVASVLPFASLNQLLDPTTDGALVAGLVLLATTVGLTGLAAALLRRRDIQ